MPAGSTRQPSSPSRGPSPRRGVTLVEMLVVVALIVLMMTILVQIFQSATGAMSASRETQELDVILRQIDSTIKADLDGVTAKMTPPNDPRLKTGYFEYGENSPADAQGEDSDDYLAFTVKAPEGQVFSGRQWLFFKDPTTGAQTINQSIQPITITSQIAEVIYFLRNGNLYRRVLLVAPDRASSLFVANAGLTLAVPGWPTTLFGGSLNVSWQGVNEISCRPGGPNAPAPIPNDLGDLANRENRAFRPRFCNDLNPTDGIPDDNNGDGIDDYYPTLYYDGLGHSRKNAGGTQVDWAPNPFVLNTTTLHEVDFTAGRLRVEQATSKSYDVYAFPFIYPGMYSVPDGATVDTSGNVTPPANSLGWRHGLMPYNDATLGLVPNHSPLDIGDNLHAPASPQTWWGFPTWRETMAGNSSGGGIGWRDPINLPNQTGHVQVVGLRPFAPNQAYSIHSANFLPPIYLPNSNVSPPYYDGAGSSSFVAAPLVAGSSQSVYPNPVWEDDLILTGVRSFDVKAYDINAPLYNTTANGFFSSGYQDLGYGSASYLGGWVAGANPANPPWQASQIDEPIGFGHEGRIPPIPNDFRTHPRRKMIVNSSNNLVVNNIGDSSTGVIRLNRVWDSWSTDYTNAPDSDVFLDQQSPTSQPIYPSFPPPYPSPLRGIQIQIRLVNPRGQRSKVLTIRHDFTDQL